MNVLKQTIAALRSKSANGIPVGRLLVTGALLFGAAGATTYRLVDLQVVRPERYIEHGESQRIRTEEIPGQRGPIVDRNNVALAVSSPRPSIWADPRLVEDPEAVAAAVVQVAGGNEDTLVRRLSNPDAKFAWLSRQLDPDTADQIMSLELAGVYEAEEQARLTPSGSDVARGLLGRTDIDGIGISGVELVYDEALTGQPGQLVVERADRRGGYLTIPDGRYELTAPQAGDSLVLTLDRTVQFEVEKLLLKTVEESGAKSGTVIVTRPQTGEILAMATVVADDEGNVSVSTRNDAVVATIEPGSISKPLAVAALLEEDLITPQTSVEVTDQRTLYGETITDEIKHGRTNMSVADILAKSSNVGMSLLTERLSDDELHGYLSDFGLGRPTELELNGEVGGTLHPVDEWSGVSLSSASYGYGFAATPLQMLRAYNAIANDGELVEPHVVAGTRSESGDLEPIGSPDTTRVLSKETADSVTDLLSGVVSDGTGRYASVPGYEIAGKTGTARIAQPGGGYEDELGRVHIRASFAGFLPASDPELSLIVVIDDPAGETSGGQLAAPLFSEISNFALQHFRIPPAFDSSGAAR